MLRTPSTSRSSSTPPSPTPLPPTTRYSGSYSIHHLVQLTLFLIDKEILLTFLFQGTYENLLIGKLENLQMFVILGGGVGVGSGCIKMTMYSSKTG